MATLNTPNLLVIGGTGFIGHHLIKSLQQKDWNITSVSLRSPTKERFVDGVRYLHFDMVDQTHVKKYLTEEFEYVVNLGGYINHQLFLEGGRSLIETHFTALQNLLEVLPRLKLKRFVQIGSSDEYGANVAPQNESQRESPISPYSFAKTTTTHFLQMLYRTEQFPVVILRPFLVYGPGQGMERFIPQVITGCIEGKSFPTSEGKQLRDFCFIGDFVRSIFSSIDNTEAFGEVINIASGEPISIKNVVTKIQNIVAKGRPQFGKAAYRVGENMELYADITKARKLLNWQPKISLEEGLRRTIDVIRDLSDAR